MPELQPASVDIGKVIAPTPDLKPTWNGVTFGHSFRDFDRDQLATYFLARFTGMVSPDASVQFDPRPSAEVLNNPQTLVIEGGATNKTLGNFDNGPNDEPAAYMFYEAHQNQWKNHKDPTKPDMRAAYPKLKELALWIRAADTGGAMPQLSQLKTEDLKALTDIFYGIKLKHPDNPHACLDETYQMMKNLMDDKREAPLATLYEQDILRADRQASADRAAVYKHLETHPEAIQATTSATGIKLARIDIRGLDVQKGATSVGFEKTKADVLLLVADERSDMGEVIGTRFLFQLSNKTEPAQQLRDAHYLQTILAPRLNLSEALFGKGYHFTATRGFGGHPGLIGSNAMGGSELDPQRAWAAIQEHFTTPAYTQAAFTQTIDTLSQQLVAGAKYTVVLEPPQHAYDLARFQAHVTIPGRSKTLVITEKDLPLYQQAIAQQKLASADLLTPTEPAVISVLRQEQASKQLETNIAEKNAGMALAAINDLAIADIKRLPTKTMTTVLSTIATDPHAIDDIWNMHNTRFPITYDIIADWAKNQPDTYQQARYLFPSVPYKVDTIMVQELLGRAKNQSHSPHEQSPLQVVTDIVTSDAYQQLHQTAQPGDKLLLHLLRAATEKSFPYDDRATVIQRLTTEYDVRPHWQSIANDNPALLGTVSQEYPQFRSFIEKLHLAPPQHAIEGVPDSTVVPINKDLIAAHIAEQAAHGLSPMLTILVEVGQRDVEQLVEAHGGINRTESDTHGQQVVEYPVRMDSAIKVPRYISHDLHQDESGHIAAQAATMIRELITLTPTHIKVRLLRGSLFGTLSADLATALMLEFHDEPDVLARLVWCDLAQTDPGTYIDRPLVPPSLAQKGS